MKDLMQKTLERLKSKMKTLDDLEPGELERLIALPALPDPLGMKVDYGELKVDEDGAHCSLVYLDTDEKGRHFVTKCEWDGESQYDVEEYIP